MTPHEFLPGRPFAPETSLYQLGVGLQSSSASHHPAFQSASHNETQFAPEKFPKVCGSERFSPRNSDLADLASSGILSALRSETQVGEVGEFGYPTQYKRAPL
jgi:hypothetical protein